MAGIVDVKIEGLKRAQRQMSQMSEAGKDVRPIWEGYLDFYKHYVDEKWSTKGRAWGNSWKGLNNKYRTWKRNTTGIDGVTLTLTGKLKRAATGDTSAGYFQELKQLSATWGIRGIPYASIHQFGGNTKHAKMPERPYMMGADGLLPDKGELMQALFDITDLYFKENM